MNESAALECLLADEIINRFLHDQNDNQRRTLGACRSIKFDAHQGAIVLECPNVFLGSMIESRRAEWESIAAPIGLQVQIVVLNKGNRYW
jgi:hypothetical protein